MNTTRSIGTLLGGTAIAFLLIGCGGDVKQVRQENEALRAEVAALKARVSETDANREAGSKRAQAEAQDVARLRGEVTQLRNGAKDAEKLRGENQQLRNENQKLRGVSAAAASSPAPPPVPAPGAFPREAWSFAGYTTPEAALVSAIWSMQQGNPKQYFDSLTADEQLRMTKVWEGKSQAEIAAKHQADTAQISGIRVLQRDAAAEGEEVIKVFIEGVNREEKVRMKRVGNDWRFGGFIREPSP